MRDSTTSKLLKQAIASGQMQATLVEAKSFEAAANMLANKDVDAIAGDRLVMFDQLIRSSWAPASACCRRILHRSITP